MIKNLLLTVGLILAAHLLVYSQTGTLKGQVIDRDSQEPIPFCNIVIEVTGAQKGGASSDFEGNYTIKPINPGSYDVKATYVGYKPVEITGVIIKSDKITFLDIKMEVTATTLTAVEVTEYKQPLISKDQTSTGATVTSEEIAKMASRSAAAVATTVGGVFSKDGEVGSIRGQRSDNTVTYIDGIRVIGSAPLPEAAIDQVSVILGGTPSQYGDVTGGIINVTTKGPSRKFGMGIEAQTSEYLDNYGYNRVGVNLNGPVFKSKNPSRPALFGYFIAGEAIYHQDGATPANGLYKVNDEKLAQIEANPLRPTGLGFGTYYEGLFLTKNDLVHINSSLNTSNFNTNVSGKFDVSTGPNVSLSFGGNLNYYENNNYSFGNSLANYDNNTYSTGDTWRVFAKFTQRFPTSETENPSLIKNVFYTIQADYTRSNNTNYDPNHKSDFFNYGYIGQFTTYKARSYSPSLEYDSIAGLYAHLMNNFQDTLFAFQRAEINPLLANYTSQYYETHPDIQNMDQVIVSEGGIINGRNPQSIYGLFNMPGVLQSGYGKSEQDQISIEVLGSADIGNHAIQFGLQYQQRSSSAWNIAPVGLWPLMRGYANFHIQQIDFSNPLPVYLDGVFQDTINYYRRYDPTTQFFFDKNLREKMGLSVNGTDWIDIDSYDPNTNSINYYDKDGNHHVTYINGGLDLHMFSPDELLNNGDQVVGYYGYDAYGNKLKSKPSFDDFFTKKDANGNYTREVGAYEPIYMAGYIQDVFSFKDLIFNIGVRVDRFDANQKVLKDPYLLYEAKTVKEVNNLGPQPSNMGPDYVVYVDNVKNPTVIMGYRNDNTWYNAQGNEVIDPEQALDAGNGISPYLVNPDNQVVSVAAFEDYTPAINMMPRIAFSFPISDEALFYAHYDILTQRPTANFYTTPTSYYFWPITSNPTINNANLKPEKTIDYELGFQQALNASSAINISAFYREVRDQIQSYRFTGAYPKTYYSYNNIDFGTVKGLTVSYDLRRTQNARLRASYTLQFAEGTGSDPNTSLALIQSKQPNLRTLNPLDFDQRHAIKLSLDYRWSEGKDYNGPVTTKKKGDKTKNIYWLENTGFNLTMYGGSGTPYTRSSTIYPSLISGSGRLIKGSLNGSRLPWQFRLDLRVDRDFSISKGKGENATTTYLNVYFQILNLLNSRNVLFVYSATGNPNDDGYLAAAEWQTQINQQLNPESYREMYSVALDNPGNYSIPRMIRFGLSFNF
jgi:hypothetical protein